MTAEDHIIAWIESSGPHYRQLRDIHRRRQPHCPDGFRRSDALAAMVFNLVTQSYREMVRTGDADKDDPYSAVELLRAAIMLAQWEAPE